MKRVLVVMGLMLLTGAMLFGCSAPEAESVAEDVLQINNDILEDPLLKELEDLEASLMLQDPAPAEAQVPSPAEQEPASVNEAPKAAAPAPAPALLETPPSPAEPVTALSQKVNFGIVKKTGETGISLRVVEMKSLTADELRRIKNGEKIQRALLTDEVLRLTYSSDVTVEKIVNGTAVPAVIGDIVSGQTVRVTLNRAGEIAALRIIRN